MYFLDIGRIFPNLGPNYGFIIPTSNNGKNYKAANNVYFNLFAYRQGMNTSVDDLTKVLKINEEVSGVKKFSIL